jgi:hypothetical protein
MKYCMEINIISCSYDVDTRKSILLTHAYNSCLYKLGFIIYLKKRISFNMLNVQLKKGPTPKLREIHGLVNNTVNSTLCYF